MIRHRTGERGRSQYRHEPSASRKRREEIRKRARPYPVILSELMRDEIKIPKGFYSGSLTLANENVYTVLLPGETQTDVKSWMEIVEEEGFDGWDHRGNMVHIMPSEITEIKVYKK